MPVVVVVEPEMPEVTFVVGPEHLQQPSTVVWVNERVEDKLLDYITSTFRGLLTWANWFIGSDAAADIDRALVVDELEGEEDVIFGGDDESLLCFISSRSSGDVDPAFLLYEVEWLFSCSSVKFNTLSESILFLPPPPSVSWSWCDTVFMSILSMPSFFERDQPLFTPFVEKRNLCEDQRWCNKKGLCYRIAWIHLPLYLPLVCPFFSLCLVLCYSGIEKFSRGLRKGNLCMTSLSISLLVQNS